MHISNNINVFKNFTKEYKDLLLEAEATAKKQGFGSLESTDLVLEILRSGTGLVFEIFADF